MAAYPVSKTWRETKSHSPERIQRLSPLWLSDLEGSASVCRGCWDALAAPVTLKGWWDALSLQYRVYAGMRWVSSTLSCS